MPRPCNQQAVLLKLMPMNNATQITEEEQRAQQVYQQAVVLRLMPMNNATQITDAERAAIKRWYETRTH